MDTYKVTIFPSAESDLHNIFIYILDKLVSPNTALEIYNNLLQMILSLETYPTRGSLRKVGQYRNQGFRQLFYKNYTIVHTVKDNKKEVHIIAVKYSHSNF